MTSGRLRVVVYSQSGLRAEALCSLVGDQARFIVVGYANDVSECLALLRDQGANTLCADALGITERARTFIAGAQLVQDFSLVLIGEESTSKSVGGKTFSMSTQAGSDELFDLLTNIAASSEVYRSPARIQSTMGLSMRQWEIVDLVAKGFTNKQISETLNLRDTSVKNMVYLVLQRLGCENRTQLALKAKSHLDSLPVQ